MKLFFHFAVVGFANTYLLGPEEGGNALLIDPGTMDAGLLNLIEGHGYYVSSILLTHSHPSHMQGIKTLKKIYDADIYAHAANIYDFTTHSLTDGQTFTTCGIKVEAISIPGHSADSLVYHIGGMIFTGDVLAAGRVGNTNDSYTRALLLRSISEKLFHLPETTLIFPGHGPPSSLKAEKMFSPDLKLISGENA
jgi:glyoxylase-like metal-dependent hydrolase (beta-lactamase superfamily II)